MCLVMHSGDDQDSLGSGMKKHGSYEKGGFFFCFFEDYVKSKLFKYLRKLFYMDDWSFVIVLFLTCLNI